MDGVQTLEQQAVAAAAPAQKSLLRFLTCGSVDDGKSTLIGRLLYNSKLILDDQLAALERDSVRHGTTGEDLDLALLVDGLEAERQQGITIDVAYRFFTTDKRRVHRRRHPRPRAVHPQHGHRRLQRRPGGDPDRRPQGGADPDQAAQLHLFAAGRPPSGAGGEQDRSGRLRPAGVRPDRRRLYGIRQGPGLRLDHPGADVGPPWRQRHPALGPTRPGITARP